MISGVRFVRHCRSLLRSESGLMLYLCFRWLLAKSHGENSDVGRPVSLLELLAKSWSCIEGRLIETLMTRDLSENSAMSNLQLMLASCLLSAIRTISIVAQDLVAIAGLVALLHSFYILYHTPVREWQERLKMWLFLRICQVLRCWTNVVDDKLRLLEDKIAKEADKMLKKQPDRKIRHKLPQQGLDHETIMRELNQCAQNENASCETGKVSGTLYAPSTTSARGVAHSRLMSDVYSYYQWANPLKPGIWPRVNQCEAELIGMTANLFHGPNIGCVTSGGTESILLAVRAHWEYYGRRRGIAHPEVVCGTSAHCALLKACKLLRIRLVTLDCNDGTTFQLSARQVQNRITSNTIMIFASCPSFSQGIIDPITQLSEVATKFDIGLHVDACLGSFVVPFSDFCASEALDFRAPGVTTISADLHKYGLAAKGTSVILFRSKELRRASYFPFSQWSGGLYVTPSLAGSRPGGLVACAWAALISIGEDGYRQNAMQIIQAATKIAKTIEEIPGLILMTPRPTVVVCFGSIDFDIYNIKDDLSEMGWKLNALQNPAAINICITENLLPHVNQFLSDLETVVQKIQSFPGSKKKTTGTSTLYSVAKHLPAAQMDKSLCQFIDASLSP